VVEEHSAGAALRVFDISHMVCHLQGDGVKSAMHGSLPTTSIASAPATRFTVLLTRRRASADEPDILEPGRT